MNRASLVAWSKVRLRQALRPRKCVIQNGNSDNPWELERTRFCFTCSGEMAFLVAEKKSFLIFFSSYHGMKENSYLLRLVCLNNSKNLCPVVGPQGMVMPGPQPAKNTWSYSPSCFIFIGYIEYIILVEITSVWAHVCTCVCVCVHAWHEGVRHCFLGKARAHITSLSWNQRPTPGSRTFHL